MVLPMVCSPLGVFMMRQFIAEVLPDNTAMLRVFEHSGLRVQRKRESGVVHITLQLL